VVLLRQCIAIGITVLLVVFGSVSLVAAGDPDAAKAIIVEHCAKCHAIPRYSPEGGPDSVNAPAFSAIADNSDTYGRERLGTFLRQPHFPMTQLILSESDIENILAYIESLRTK